MHELVIADYHGIAVTFRDDGWFNASAVAKHYGKEPHEWIRSPDTARYVEALERTYGKIPYVKTSRARADRGGGTWLHPKLAVAFARWLDVDFSVWADAKIDSILRGEAPGDPDEPSTMRDRLPLHYAAVDMVQRHHVSFPVAHMANNAAAGSASYKSMTKAQVQRAVPIAQRIANGTASPADFALLEQGKQAVQGDGLQIALDLTEPQPD